MKRTKTLPLLLLLVGAFLVNAVNVFADITNVSVTPQIETGDTDKFEMVVKPGDKRVLTIAFTNFGSAVERLKIQPTNAQTDANGNFIYREIVKKGTDGLAAAFAEMTSSKRIILQPQQSKTVTINVNTPTDNFDGVIYGGLNIYSVNAQGQPLNNESTNIPVIITQTNQNVSGQGKIGGIKAEAIGYQPNIVIQLKNSKPGEAKNVAYNLMIQRKGFFSFLGFNGRKVPVYQSDLTIAPNSTLPIPVNYKQQPLKAGKYQVTGSFTINGKTKKVNETYSLSQTAVEQVNKHSKGLIYDKTWIFVLVIAGLILLIVIVIILIVRQIRNNRRQENQEMLTANQSPTPAAAPNSDPLKTPVQPNNRANYGQSNVNQFKNPNSSNAINPQNPNGNFQNPANSLNPNYNPQTPETAGTNPSPRNNSVPNYGPQTNIGNPNYQQPFSNATFNGTINPQAPNGINSTANNYQQFPPNQPNSNSQNYGNYAPLQPNNTNNWGNSTAAPNSIPNQSLNSGNSGAANYYPPNGANNFNNQVSSPNPNQAFGNQPNGNFVPNSNQQQQPLANNGSYPGNNLNNSGGASPQNPQAGSSASSKSGVNSNESDDGWDQLSIDDLLKKH